MSVTQSYKKKSRKTICVMSAKPTCEVNKELKPTIKVNTELNSDINIKRLSETNTEYKNQDLDELDNIIPYEAFLAVGEWLVHQSDIVFEK